MSREYGVTLLKGFDPAKTDDAATIASLCYGVVDVYKEPGVLVVRFISDEGRQRFTQDLAVFVPAILAVTGPVEVLNSYINKEEIAIPTTSDMLALEGNDLDSTSEISIKRWYDEVMHRLEVDNVTPVTEGDV